MGLGADRSGGPICRAEGGGAGRCGGGPCGGAALLLAVLLLEVVLLQGKCDSQRVYMQSLLAARQLWAAGSAVQTQACFCQHKSLQQCSSAAGCKAGAAKCLPGCARRRPVVAVF